jgi:hypothetical protein
LQGSSEDLKELFQLGVRGRSSDREVADPTGVGGLHQTNSSLTFKRLMNKKFRPHRTKFVLVFFDDILIYRKSWEENIKHVDQVLKNLENNKLYVKRSKCSFGKQEVE